MPKSKTKKVTRPKDMTAANMKRFVAFCKRKYNVQFLNKNSPMYKLILWAVDAMGIPDPSAFLEKWSMTIGRFVWLSFTPGQPNSPQAIAAQVCTIGHELKHVEQWRRDKAKFPFRYVGSASRRAHYETEALHVNLELGYSLPHAPAHARDYRELANKLRAYMVRRADIAVTKKHLRIYDKVARQGGRSEQITKDILKWWNVS